jgi:hypothetical protein
MLPDNLTTLKSIWVVKLNSFEENIIIIDNELKSVEKSLDIITLNNSAITIKLKSFVMWNDIILRTLFEKQLG